jgi:hypothetical protein
VTKQGPVDKGTYMWECRCSCGHVDLVASSNLKRGASTRCVKCRGKISEVTNRRHGGSGRKNGTSPEYKCWAHMKDRCLNPSNDAYAKYGGRGITVFPEWIEDFQAFVAHIGSRPSLQHSIERINNNGNYEPGNVCWATRREQAWNRRSNPIITIDGISGTLPHLCELLGLDYKFVSDRVYRVLSRRTPQQAANAYRALKTA